VPFILRLPGPGRASYAIGAGTLSRRTRGTPASFSTIVAEEAAFQVTAQAWSEDHFEPLWDWTLPRGLQGSGEPAAADPALITPRS